MSLLVLYDSTGAIGETSGISLEEWIIVLTLRNVLFHGESASLHSFFQNGNLCVVCSQGQNAHLHALSYIHYG